MAGRTDRRGGSRWWKPALAGVAAAAAAAAAVVAWGWAKPVEPEVVLEEEEAGVAPAPPQQAAAPPAPAWVKPTVLWTIGVIVAVIVGAFLLGVLSEVVTWILLALFFSFAMEPGVNYLHAKRGWRRGSATTLLLGLVFLMFVVLILIFVPTLIKGVTAIAQRAPEWADQLSEWTSDTLGIDISTAGVSDGAASAVTSLNAASPVEALLGVTFSLIEGIFAFFTVGMFIFYMVAEGPKFKRSVLAFFPQQRQEELVAIWEAAIDKTGGYFYSKMLLMVINGGLMFIVLRVTEVPGAASLAVFQGFVAEFIPIVGTYIAAIVPLVAAAFSVGMPETLIILIYVLIYQQVENYLLSPKLQSKTMKLHPAVAFGAALAGGAIGGLLWAFLAIPFAATVQASASLWLEQHEVVETEFTSEPPPARPRKPKDERPGFAKRATRWVRARRGFLRRKEETEPEAAALDVDVIPTEVVGAEPAQGA